MFKKLLSLAAAAAMCFGAHAEWVTDYTIDYSNYSEFPFYVMGYTPTFADGLMISENPMEEIKDELPAPSWYQYFVADGIRTEVGQDYTVIVTIKASEPVTFNLNMGWGWGEGQQIGKPITVGTEWKDIELKYEEIGGTSCNLVAQPGVSTAKIEWKKIEVGHNQKAQRPVEYVEWLVNGDAEGEYGDVPCAWGKSNLKDDPTTPVAADIEAVDGGHAFVVHAGAMTEFAWDNQFWIMADQKFVKGDQVMVSFRYKASKPAKVTTQQHQAAGEYCMWWAIGDINFTTDWQEFVGTFTVDPGDHEYISSIAFNLNELADANDYYFDDLSWKTMKLDEGYFVAGDFMDADVKSIELGDAVEFEYDDDLAVYKATIGTVSMPASKIKISTKRGQDAAFNSNLLKIDDAAIEATYANAKDEVFDIEAVDYIDYVAGGSKWVNLPKPGIWTILLDEDYQQIAFILEEDLSGIASVTVENAPVVYYNLQGVRVENPNNGIFIVKKGNKVTKQVIR